ncbi:MAG: DUF424 family protein [Candidatus Altiarchaeota archaeon]|nr:DUF424 family protein [Candidatus Altiarchaeota archaeon]
MFCVKVHSVDGDVLVAGCDKELLGTVLNEGGLEVKVNERFYGGEVVDSERLLAHVRDATIVNIIGDRIVDLALKEGLVGEDSVRTVGGVKHAQMITVE